MSIFTERNQVKSLWHPITDEDFDIDTSKPFVLFSYEAKLILIKDKVDMVLQFDEGLTFDENGKFTDEGKEHLRNIYFAYMYLDEEFYEAIKPFAETNHFDQVKGTSERPCLFVRYKDGEIILFDSFDFGIDGSYPDKDLYSTPDFYIEYPDGAPIDYVVNLEHCMATNPQAIFLQPVAASKVYVVTSDECS